MCANGMIMPDKEFDQSIVEKYNNQIQKERIESSIVEIIENLEKLYFLD